MATISRFILIVSFALTAGFFTGCASTMCKMTVDSMKPLLEDMRSSTNRNPDADLVRAAMPAVILQMDGFIRVSPENRYLLYSAAEINMGYAFLFIEDMNKDRAELLYLKARDYALRNLSRNQTFRTALAQDDAQVFTRALKTIHKRDIAALYFATNSWLQWINLASSDNPEALKDLPRVEAMMERARLLDDTFYHGGIHALYGVYYITRQGISGGKPGQAREQFDEAFRISESKYLLWPFLYAKYYAVQTKDRELFVSTLNRIVSAPDDLLPEEAFVNAAVRQKARDLLLHVDDYFR